MDVLEFAVDFSLKSVDVNEKSVDVNEEICLTF